MCNTYESNNQKTATFEYVLHTPIYTERANLNTTGLPPQYDPCKNETINSDAFF